MPTDLIHQYTVAIDRLQNIGFDTVDSELGEGWQPKDTAHIVPFTDGGQQLLFTFFNRVNKQLCDDAESDRLSSMHGKFDVHAPRLALVLQMLWYGYQEAGREAITEVMTERALKLTQWFRSQSMKVHRYLYESGPLDSLSTLEHKFYNQLPLTFSTNEAKFTGKAGCNYSERTTQRLLKRWVSDDLITKSGRGEYAKMY